MSSISFPDALKKSRVYDLITGDLKIGLGNAYAVISSDDDALRDLFTLLAARIVCENQCACLSCAQCRKVLHNNHPDVVFINSGRERLKVADVNAMLAFVNIKPLGEHKLYFTERADLMTPEAQNKLLKTLEEPPEKVTFFIGAANESGLLDTVKSRCRTLYMDVFDAQTIARELKKTGCEATNAEIAAACSEGQLGKARKIASSPEYAEIFEAALNSVEKLKKSADVAALDSDPVIAKNPSEYLNALSIIFRDMLVLKNDPDLVFSKHIATKLSEIGKEYSEAALSRILPHINETRRKLSLNVGLTAAIDSLFFSVLEEKHKWR